MRFPQGHPRHLAELTLYHPRDPFDMKKTFLIFLMLVLPWQAIAAMERNFDHLSGGGGMHGSKALIKHMVEHAEHVLHHHDEDGDGDDGGTDANGGTHVDNSQKSVHHLADYDQAGSMHLLLPALGVPFSATITRFPPAFWRDPFRTRSVVPLLRPPRLPA